MSNALKLLKHSSHYFAGELLIVVSGLVSFPIFTRIFTTEEYGMMSLLNITISLIGLVASLGLRPAVLRFYPLSFKEGGAKSVNILYSTSLILTVVMGSGLSLIVYILSYTPVSFLPKEQSYLLRVAAGLILIRPMFQLLLSFIRVEQKTISYNIWYVLQQYITLATSLVCVLLLSMGLLGLIASQLFVEGLFVSFLFFFFFYRRRIYSNIFSGTIAKQLCVYGIPLILLNFSHIIMTSGDRYVLTWLLGLNSVGIYSVGYNLSNYMGILLQTPFNTAIGPIYMEMWEKEGKAVTENFLSRIVMYYLIISVGLLGGCIAVGKEAIVLIASDKYVEAYLVAPFILAGILLSGVNNICAAGLYVQKNTKIYGILVLKVAVANVVFNIILVPFLGISGAAIATILAYLILFVIIRRISFQYLKISFNLWMLLKSAIASVCMIVTLWEINLKVNIDAVSLLLKICIGVVIYMFLMLVLDKRIRADCYQLCKTVNPRQTE